MVSTTTTPMDGANPRRYAACNNQNEDFVRRGIVDENGQREGRVMMSHHHGSYGRVHHEPSDMVGV